MNQPLPGQGVATTGTESVSGSSLGHVPTSEPHPFHHTTNGHSAMENILHWLRDAAHSAGIEKGPDSLLAQSVEFLLDYDGTLAPAGMPHSTTAPNPGIKAALRKLISIGAGVSLVSGKDVNGLQELLGDVEGMKYSGLFGLEYDLGDGNGVHYHPDVTEQQLDAVAAVYGILNNQFSSERFPGIEVEHQGSLKQRSEQDQELRQRMLVTTLVWKACDDFDAQRAIDKVRAIASEHGLEVNVGTGYINVGPFFPGKNGAIETILFSGELERDQDLSSPVARKAVVFIGDEEPDIHAFNKSRELHGDGVIASFVNLGVTQPVYEKVHKTVYQWGRRQEVTEAPNRPEVAAGFEPDLEQTPQQAGSNRPSKEALVFLETGEHKVDEALELSADLDDHGHMLLPGPRGVAQFLTLASRQLNVPVGRHEPPEIGRPPIALSDGR